MKELLKKLFEVKKENVKLQRKTNAYNYKYATLDQIQQKLNPILKKNGLLVIHQIIDGEVKTSIMDIETGESIVSGIKLSEGTKAQDKGSEITYYRRYNLVSLLDLEVEDDDGQQAMKKTKEEFTKEKFEEVKNKIKKEDLEKIKKKYIVSKEVEKMILGL